MVIVGSTQVVSVVPVSSQDEYVLVMEVAVVEFLAVYTVAFLHLYFPHCVVAGEFGQFAIVSDFKIGPAMEDLLDDAGKPLLHFTGAGQGPEKGSNGEHPSEAREPGAFAAEQAHGVVMLS